MPTTFADSEGRTWTCRVTWGAIRRSTAAGVDLSLVEEHLGDFCRGSIKLIDALWAVVGPDATTQQVTREQFEDALTGQHMDEARGALLEGLRDFFPSQRAELIAKAAAEVQGQMAQLLDSTSASTGSPEA